MLGLDDPPAVTLNRRLAVYVRQVAAAIGVPAEATGYEVTDTATAYLGLDQRWATQPDHDLMLLWDERLGWYIAVETTPTETPVVLAYLHGDTVPTPDHRRPVRHRHRRRPAREPDPPGTATDRTRRAGRQDGRRLLTGTCRGNTLSLRPPARAAALAPGTRRPWSEPDLVDERLVGRDVFAALTSAVVVAKDVALLLVVEVAETLPVGSRVSEILLCAVVVVAEKGVHRQLGHRSSALVLPDVGQLVHQPGAVLEVRRPVQLALGKLDVVGERDGVGRKRAVVGQLDLAGVQRVTEHRARDGHLLGSQRTLERGLRSRGDVRQPALLLLPGGVHGVLPTAHRCPRLIVHERFLGLGQPA